ncbi:MAG: hypothetical protein MJ239_00515 [Bacilli bacterium]|nr:hypothetical protein [Bacilli bacterium]
MSEEEKKETPVVEEAPTEEEEFADFKKPEPVVEEKPAEEAAEAATVEAAEEEKKEEEPEEVEEPTPTVFEYDADPLQNIEDQRVAFFKDYKGSNKWKILATVIALFAIVAGWILPTQFIPNVGIYFAIGIAILAVIGLAVFSFLSRKNIEKKMKAYFQNYYDRSYQYAMEGLPIEGFKGDLDQKLSDEEFNACALYDDVFKIGSRYGTTFTYDSGEGKIDCAMIDAAAQVKGKKALETVFVGKYLRMPNTYNGSGLVVYFKGNKRALPPTNVSGLNVLEENAKMVIYGEESERKYISREIRKAFTDVRTNKILVDVAIAIKPGKTYFLLGYEDDLMVIPLQNAFNPNPLKEFKANVGEFLAMGALFNK